MTGRISPGDLTTGPSALWPRGAAARSAASQSSAFSNASSKNGCTRVSELCVEAAGGVRENSDAANDAPITVAAASELGSRRGEQALSELEVSGRSAPRDPDMGGFGSCEPVPLRRRQLRHAIAQMRAQPATAPFWCPWGVRVAGGMCVASRKRVRVRLQHAGDALLVGRATARQRQAHHGG
jgi:hypothetical protein